MWWVMSFALFLQGPESKIPINDVIEDNTVKIEEPLPIASGNIANWIIIINIVVKIPNLNIGCIWCSFSSLSVIFDIPHILFKAPATPSNIKEGVIESMGVLILGIITTLYIYRILKRLKHVSGFLHICAQCKRIKIEGTWIPLEEFMSKYSEVKLSHGLCHECYKKAEETLWMI